VGALLGASVRTLKQGVAARAAEHGLTPRQFGILVALFESERPTLRELATRLRIDEPTTSRVVHTLARRRLVRAEPDPDDRRRVHLATTSVAESLRRPLLAIAREVRAAVVLGFSPAERRRLEASLRRVLENSTRWADAARDARPARAAS
jgi:DNA-binding MarR family transcriptional regulator